MKFFNSLFLLFVITTLNAQTIQNNEIIDVAKKAMWEHLGANKHMDDKQVLIKERINNISIVTSETFGTVFVGNKNNNLQVFGYSSIPYNKKTDIPSGLKLWLEAANEYCYSGDTKESPYTTVKPVNIEPFVTTKWDQDKPFYNKCPKVGLKNSATGCVATAMAQIMNYYKYPEKGTGECQYQILKVVAGKETVTGYTAVLSDIYDWDNMLDVYKDNQYNTKQADAVATLMRDCGYASSMQFGKQESSAYFHLAAIGFTDNFSYNNRSLQYLTRDFYSNNEWMNIIYSELIEKRPILYGGSSVSQGAHAFVFSGLNQDGKVHINWGWGGMLDGYFDINVMSSNAKYTLNQDMVIGIKPELATESSPYEYEPQIMINLPKLSCENEKLMFSGIIANYDWRDFSGDIAILLENKTKNLKDTLLMVTEKYENENGDIEVFSLKTYSGWIFGDSTYNTPPLVLNVDDNDNTWQIEEGEYDCSFIQRAFFQKNFIPCRGKGGFWKSSFSVDKYGNISGVENGTTDAEKVVINNNEHQIKLQYNLKGQPTTATTGLIIQNGKIRIVK